MCLFKLSRCTYEAENFTSVQFKFSRARVLSKPPFCWCSLHLSWVVACFVLSSFSLLMLPLIDFKSFDRSHQNFPCFFGNEGIFRVFVVSLWFKAASLAGISARDWCTKSTVMTLRIVNRDRILGYFSKSSDRFLLVLFSFPVSQCVAIPQWLRKLWWRITVSLIET